MAHPFAGRKLHITVCKAEVGWDQADATALESASVRLVAGPFKSSTRNVPVSRSARGNCGQLSWAPTLGAELFVLTEDCVLLADMVIGAELWGRRGNRWNSDSLYAQADIVLDAAGQALLLSGRCLDVRLPLLQPHSGGGGGGGAGGGGGRSGKGQAAAAAAAVAAAAAAASGPVLGMLALSMLLQPADAEADVVRHLPVELVPRLLLDTTRLLPGAALRGAAGAAYVDPCVVFIRVRLSSASGLGRSSHHRDSTSSLGGQQLKAGSGRSRGPAAPSSLHDLGNKLQAAADRTMGHIGAFISRLKDGGRGEGSNHGSNDNSSHRGGAQATLASHALSSHDLASVTVAAASAASATIPAAAEGQQAAAGGAGGGIGSVERQGGGGRGTSSMERQGSGDSRSTRTEGVDQAGAEAALALMEANGFAVVDNRRLSKYFWCKVSYESQVHTSRLVPVLPGGSVRWDETFVIAVLRPVRPAQLEIELFGSNDSKSRGKSVCQLSVPLCDVVDQVVVRQQQQRREQQEREQREQQAVRRERQEQEREQQAARLGQRQAAHAASGTWFSLRGVFKAVPKSAPDNNQGGASSPSSLPPKPSPALPDFHPDTWPRGRVDLTARIGSQQPAGAGSAVFGSPGHHHHHSASGGSGSRECVFHLDLEMIDADPRATANGTQLLPWAPQPPASGSGMASNSGAIAAVGGGGDGAATPRGDSSFSATRQGSAGSSGTVAVAAGEGGGAGGTQPLSPPWSPPSGGDGGDGTLSPTASSVMLSNMGGTASTQQPATPRHAPPAPLVRPGEEDLWMPSSPSQPLPAVHTHTDAHARGSELGTEAPSTPAAQQAQGSNSQQQPQQPPQQQASAPGAVDLGRISAFASSLLASTSGAAPSATFGGAAGAAAAAAAPDAAIPPAPGMCSAAALATSAAATLSLVVHDVELELPPDAMAGGGGSGGTGGGLSVGGMGKEQSHQAAVAALAGLTQGDYFLVLRCGNVWATTNSLRASGGGVFTTSLSGGSDGGGPRMTPRWGVVVPLLKPSAVLTLALFRRTDTVAGKKVLNVRAMIGMMASEQLVGKLRLRASSLVPGRPIAVCLPLRGERSGPRPCASFAWCRITALLSLGPGGLPALINAYADPPTYPPVAMLQEGAVPGRGLSATFPLTDPAMRVDSDTLRRRERRLIIKWVSESSPGVSSSAARKLVEDGRTEFNAGRTTENWKRIGRALSATEPMQRFWMHVQSWQQPGLTLAVVAAEVAVLVWPSRGLAVLLLALVVHLVRGRRTLVRPAGTPDAVAARAPPLPSSSSASASGPSAGEGGKRRGMTAGSASGAAGSGGSSGGGGGEATAMRGGCALERAGATPYFGEPGAMVEDIGADPEPAATALGGRPTDNESVIDSNGSGGSGVLSPSASLLSNAAAASAVSATSSQAPADIAPAPSVPIPGSSTTVTSAATSAATAAATWILGTPPPSATGSIPIAAATTAAGGADNDWAAHQQHLLQRGGGGGGSAGGFLGLAQGSEVPKDPLAALRQQYDQLLYFGLRVQNVLDDIAGGMERVQALLSWRDPVATFCYVLGLLVTAATLWYMGLRFVLGALLLFDLRPPIIRAPWLPPPLNAFTHLPTRADLMM